MRPGSWLINTARGGLLVEADLRDSLISGHLAGAGLDVLNHEPPEPGNPLLGLPNVVLSPQIAGVVNGGQVSLSRPPSHLVRSAGHTWNDEPQPHDFTTLGLLKTNPRFSRLS